MYPAPSAKKAALLTHTAFNPNHCLPGIKKGSPQKVTSQVTKLRLLNSVLTQSEWSSKIPHFHNTEAGDGNTIGRL